MVRGTHSRTEAAFIAEASAALQFPLYTGRGWNAFDESLRQYWIPTEAIIVLVAGAQELLADERETTAETLATIIAGANLDRRPLRVILQTEPGSSDRLPAGLHVSATLET
ncbi:MAG: barstar family protein [Dehalococcoidia bacterium]